MLRLCGRQVINTDHIVRIENIDHREGTPFVRYTLSNGDQVSEGAVQLERFDYHGSTIIPAPVGFEVIQAIPPETSAEEWTYRRDPILAFAIPSDTSSPIPVLIDGWKMDGDHWAIRHPGGRCESPHDADLPTEGDWIEHIKSQWERERAQR